MKALRFECKKEHRPPAGSYTTPYAVEARRHQCPTGNPNAHTAFTSRHNRTPWRLSWSAPEYPQQSQHICGFKGAKLAQI
jgi:hypothetical protein